MPFYTFSKHATIVEMAFANSDSIVQTVMIVAEPVRYRRCMGALRRGW
jgi:hypothetical protein